MKEQVERRRLKDERKRRLAVTEVVTSLPGLEPASTPVATCAPAAAPATPNIALPHKPAPESAVLMAAAAQPPVLNTPIAFLFPGQGSQVIGMLKVQQRIHTVVSFYARGHVTTNKEAQAMPCFR